MSIENKLNLISKNYLKLNQNKKNLITVTKGKQKLFLDNSLNFRKFISKKLTTNLHQSKIKWNWLKFENKQFLSINCPVSSYFFSNQEYLCQSNIPESKQKFKSFNYLYFNYINQSFIYFLEFIFYNTCLKINSENLNFKDSNNENKDLNLKKSKKPADIFKKTNSANQSTINLSLRAVNEICFSTFLQSFTSQIYFKRKFTKTVSLKLTNKNFPYSTEESLNIYYAELWKQKSYFNFSNFSNQNVFLEMLFYSKNFTNQLLLNLFYIAQQVIFTNQVEENVSKSFVQNLPLGLQKVTNLRNFKNSKINVYFIKKRLKTFYYDYFGEFSLKNSFLKFQNYSLNFYFRNLLEEEPLLKNSFPQFLIFKNLNFLNLNYISVKYNNTQTNKFLNYPLSKNKILDFEKSSYSFFANFKNFLTSSKVFNFSKKYYPTYFPITSLSQKPLSSELIMNQDIKIIEKMFFEILQQTYLKKERTMNLNQLKHSIFYYFSPLISKNYFIASKANSMFVKNSILCFQFFNIWLKKHSLSNLPSAILMSLNSSSSLNQSSTEHFPLLSSYNLEIFPNLYSAEDSFICPSFNKLNSKTNILRNHLNQIEKVHYLKNLKQITKRYSSQTQENLIYKLTPYVLSWSYVYHFNLKTYEWCKFDKLLSQYLWRWSCRRHNNKSKVWIQSKYFFTLNKEIWFFGQLSEEKESPVKPISFMNRNLPSSNSLKKNLKVVYLPFHVQVHRFLHSS